MKAIRIKEELLGPDDYEVALSIGHLASLYNYDLHEYDKAEALYTRSIDIGLKLFGPSYSGLEYDYRGLIRIYESTRQLDKCQEWHAQLRSWREARDEAVKEEQQMEEEVGVGEQHLGRGIVRNASFYLGAGAASDATPKPICVLIRDLGHDGQ